MIDTMRLILEGVLERLTRQATTYLPSFLAAAIIMLFAYVTALLTRWLLYRIFKGTGTDRFLRKSGLAFMIDRSGRLRATRLVAEAVYWLILVAGFLTGLGVFDTDLTTQMTQRLVLLLPKMAIAVLIFMGGLWLSQYLGRGMLVWAVNEGLPSPRTLAGAVRVLILFVAVVVAAEYLDFAGNVFLAAFIILLGGAVLAASLALGLGGRDAAGRYFEERRAAAEETGERSLWNHL